MAKVRQQTFSVPATGIGRVDYSQNVQKAVEPVTQGWQQTYSDYQAFALGVGETGAAEVLLPADYTLLLYNLYLSCEPASDIALEVFSYDAETGAYGATPLVAKIGNQNIDVYMEKGYHFNTKYEVVAVNLGAAPIDCYYTAQGILTLAEQLMTLRSETDWGVWSAVIP